MAVSVIEETKDTVTLQITVQFNRSMMESESRIQDALNEAGAVATGKLLKRFDTDGSPLTFGSVRLTSKGLMPKTYQTPYGEIPIERHVYQTAKGGKTYCPLEKDARIIITSTPRFAMQISHKMAEMTASGVVDDLKMNHNRPILKRFVQDLSEAVSAGVHLQEESWSYGVPEIKESEIVTISTGLDGTCMLMCEGSYRQAMVGTIALYDKAGTRQHTTYIAAPPEYGKETFKERLKREIENTKKLYPKALWIGIADGASDNWTFLEKHTDKQTLDFYHATEYLTKVADCLFSEPIKRKEWLESRCHELKHTPGSAANILKEMEELSMKKLRKTSSKKALKQLEPVKAAITYFHNNTEKYRMTYAENREANLPIGSGVTEAACKTIVKQRLCKSGMRWKEKGAGVILSLRALSKSTGRWEQFWSKINDCGFPVAP